MKSPQVQPLPQYGTQIQTDYRLCVFPMKAYALAIVVLHQIALTSRPLPAITSTEELAGYAGAEFATNHDRSAVSSTAVSVAATRPLPAILAQVSAAETVYAPIDTTADASAAQWGASHVVGSDVRDTFHANLQSRDTFDADALRDSAAHAHTRLPRSPAPVASPIQLRALSPPVQQQQRQQLQSVVTQQQPLMQRSPGVAKADSPLSTARTRVVASRGVSNTAGVQQSEPIAPISKPLPLSDAAAIRKFF
jgi:hypothetical protein